MTFMTFFQTMKIQFWELFFFKFPFIKLILHRSICQLSNKQFNASLKIFKKRLCPSYAPKHPFFLQDAAQEAQFHSIFSRSRQHKRQIRATCI
jgi:hypothetical protein